MNESRKHSPISSKDNIRNNKNILLLDEDEVKRCHIMSDEYLPEDELNLGHYEGERNENEERHGRGKAYFPNGDVYVGMYENGRRHGEGSYRFSNGSLYEGSYLWNRRDGHGMMVFPDGSKYEGNWSEDCRHGKGTYYYINDDIYEGEWFKNYKNGEGTYTCKNTLAKVPVIMRKTVPDNIFHLKFVFCKNRFLNFDGPQISQIRVEKKTTGTWHNGKLDGPVRLELGEYIFEGTYKNNMLTGPGRFIFPNNKTELTGTYVIIEQEDDSLHELDEEESQKKYVSIWRTETMGPVLTS